MILASWILILAYMAVILFFVIKGALKIKDMKDYAVGNVNFSPIAVGLALAASMTSAATFIINPGFIALYGFSAIISYGFALPIAAMVSLVLFTKGFRKHGTGVKALTMAQWMGTRYNSKNYGFFFAVLSLLLVTFIVLIVVGLTKVLAKSLNVDELYVLIGLVTFIFGYMMFGGANSMVYTNTIQAVIMIVVAFILLGSGYEHFSSGIHQLIEKMNNIDPKLTGFFNDSSFLFRDFFEIIIAQMIIGIAIVCQPHIITKSLLLKSDKDVNRYLTVGVITQSLFFLVVISGLWARFAFPDLTVNGTPLKMDGIISAYVVKEFPVYVGLIVILGLISAGISTLEGLIQSLSTTITTDIIVPISKLKFNDIEIKHPKLIVIINRAVIVLLAVVTIYLSYEQLINPKLSVAILGQNGVYAYFSAAFIPILFGMFSKNINKLVPIVTSVSAVVVHFTMYFGKLNIPFSVATGENPGVAAATAIVVSTLLAFVLSRILKGSKQ